MAVFTIWKRFADMTFHLSVLSHAFPEGENISLHDRDTIKTHVVTKINLIIPSFVDNVKPWQKKNFFIWRVQNNFHVDCPLVWLSLTVSSWLILSLSFFF